MKLAIATPVVTMLPSSGSHWEQTGTIRDIGRIAQEADRLGYHHMTCSEHIGVPASEAPRRGARYWDPLATFGYVAAITEQILLATHVLVLGYHHPLEIAKRYGTLDVVSGGRLVLGVGVGSLEEEFDVLGVPFDDRGPRAVDALRALRASFSQPEPAYEGDYYRYSGLVIDPCSVQDEVPIWIGGRTLRSLRRAVTMAHGWCPFAINRQQVREWLDQVVVPDGFEVALMTPGSLDPLAAPDRCVEVLGKLAESGATIAVAAFESKSLAHYLEQLNALAELHER